MPVPETGPNTPLFIVLNAASGSEDAVQARQVIEEGCAAADRRLRIFTVDRGSADDGPGSLRALAREAVERARAA
ncbi:MAG: diacylglycerol kinase, partial [Variovorax sp.]